MLRVGLTGGIGAGKSTVSALLAAHGAVVIDADLLAREVVAPGTAGLAAVARAFGPEVLRADGSLDRERLADLVFADSAARARLTAIVHPLIAAATAERVQALPPDSVVVHDVALLVENGLAPSYDEVIVVEAPRDLRLRRLAERGMSRKAAVARMAAQAGDDERRAVATALLSNGGTLSELRRDVDAVWARLRRRAAGAAHPWP